jgi:hypothetical protein
MHLLCCLTRSNSPTSTISGRELNRPNPEHQQTQAKARCEIFACQRFPPLTSPRFSLEGYEHPTQPTFHRPRQLVSHGAGFPCKSNRFLTVPLQCEAHRFAAEGAVQGAGTPSGRKEGRAGEQARCCLGELCKVIPCSLCVPRSDCPVHLQPSSSGCCARHQRSTNGRGARGRH